MNKLWTSQDETSKLKARQKQVMNESWTILNKSWTSYDIVMSKLKLLSHKQAKYWVWHRIDFAYKRVWHKNELHTTPTPHLILPSHWQPAGGRVIESILLRIYSLWEQMFRWNTVWTALYTSACLISCTDVWLSEQLFIQQLLWATFCQAQPKP